MPELHAPHLNAVKHGCCAARCSARSPVLPGETEAEWREVETLWFTEYDPQTPVSCLMVSEAAHAYWLMLRNRRRFQDCDLGLAGKEPLAWTEEDHGNYGRFQRYKTAADRAFSTAFKNLEYLRKARLSEAEALRRFEAQLQALALKNIRDEGQLALDRTRFEFDRQQREASQAAQGSVPAAPPEKPSEETFDLVEQCIEVTVVEGVTKTGYRPANEDILEALKTNHLEPKLVARHFHFPHGVPSEYAWTNCRGGGSRGSQCMTFATWQQVIERESQTPGQHAGPTGVGNLPQPKDQ